MACFEPLPLMRMIYTNLPYITNLDSSNRLESNASLTDVFALDHIYRDVFWGCSIIIATVLLMILTGIYCCCTCIVCCCIGDCLDRKKPTGVKIGCGLINTLFVIVGLAVIGGSLWAEVMLDRSLQSAVSDTSNSTVSFAGGAGAAFFISAEAIWHWVLIGYLIILAIFLLVVLLSFITSPLCKNPAAILILLVFVAVFTLMTSVMAGAMFSFLILLGDICIALNNLPGGCLTPEAFCNGVYYHGFILCMLSCGLVIIFVLIQIFAPLYASTLTGVEEEEKQKPVKVFQSAGGVWNAYGTQQVLGVTSQAQPISEDVVLSEVEPPQYNDVVTGMQEV